MRIFGETIQKKTKTKLRFGKSPKKEKLVGDDRNYAK